MANPEHLQILKQGVEVWNAWRKQNEGIRPYLSDANLSGATLTDANLSNADLIGADLSRADLRGASLYRASLDGATLHRATLREADLNRAGLRGADLNRTTLTKATLSWATLPRASLTRADLRGATLYETMFISSDLTKADLSEVILFETVFSDTDLTAVRGLDSCIHEGPSNLDHRTLTKSGPLPLAFLQGCGLPDALIDYLPSLLNQPFQFYSCFISYASKDHAFAERLHADLQDEGVRCWFAPEDMKIGDRIRPRIDETIRLYDKLLLVLSKTSVASQWVEQEVETALARERQQQTTILFPVRIDNTVMTLNASRLILRHSNTFGGASPRLQPEGLPWTPQSLIGSI